MASLDRRRVVVTGLGLATSLGLEVEEAWQAMLAGRSGIGFIRQFDSRGWPVRAGGEVDLDRLPAAEEEPEPAVASNRALRLAAWAGRRAWEAAGLGPGSVDPWRAGVCVGGGAFPVLEALAVECTPEVYAEAGRLNRRYLEICARQPELLSQQDLSAVSGLLSRRLGLRGPSLTVQAACASGTLAVGEACRMIRQGRADLVVTGAADSTMSMLSVVGFTLLGALSRNPRPEAASRPFDRKRDGFVLGEGAGIAVLEGLDHARGRGAPILAEVAGYGATCDAYRFTDMHPEVQGAVACMRAALADAGIGPERVGYVNAHGTATPQNDRLETLALKRAFGEHAGRLAVSSTKSQLGHLLCGAGGVEMVVTTLALRDQVLPPTLNLDHPDPDCDLDYVPNRARPAEVEVALSNSFGFGGQNGTLVLRRWQG